MTKRLTVLHSACAGPKGARPTAEASQHADNLKYDGYMSKKIVRHLSGRVASSFLWLTEVLFKMLLRPLRSEATERYIGSDRPEKDNIAL